MPEQQVTVEVLLARLKAITEAVGDMGVVITEERYVDEHSWAKLFTSLDDQRRAKGVAWLWQGPVSQAKGPRVGTVQVRHRFSMEMLRPFDEASGGFRSQREFVAKWQELNAALNRVVVGQPQWSLGITDAEYPGADVEHQFLQGDVDCYARQWGAGSTALKTHFISNTLEVLVVANAYAL